MSPFKRRKLAMISQARHFRAPSESTFEAVHALLSGIDCPRSLAVWIIIRDDPLQLKTLTFDPFHYETMAECRDAYLATKVVSKASFFKVANDPKLEAMKKFEKCELLCKRTNERFLNPSLDPQYNGSNVWLYNTFKRKVSRILGSFSPDEMFDRANWGPGVTTHLKGLEASAPNKFQCETGITRDLYALIAPLIQEGYPIWGDHLQKVGFPQFDIGNKVVTVPKDAFVDRVIAVEPGINLWFQKGIGSIIKRKLWGYGIDLSLQKWNQQGALAGSINSHLATVDFSSASDTVSRELVRDCVPQPWLAVMEASRSHFGLSEAEPRRWEKFSSMGNGFTFELESLFFFAAALSVCEYLGVDVSEISVYGDDVIIPTPAFDLFSSFCAFLGFSVNSDKTFTSSCPFRESCGMHYWDGVDITPIFIKKIARTLGEFYRQLNAIRRLAHRRGATLCCDASMKVAWLVLFRRIPKALRIFGTDGKGDGFIIGNFDEATPTRASFGIEGYLIEHFTEAAVKRFDEGVGLLLDRLRNLSFQEQSNEYALRGQTRISFHTGRNKMLVSRWQELGPWL